MGVTGRIALVAVLLAGCRDASCIDGECPLPCFAPAQGCTETERYAGRLGDAPPRLRLRYGNGGANDILISNGRITAVFSALDAPTDLAPTGGNLIDFGTSGDIDDVTLTYQIAGILPDDAFAYHTLDVATHDTHVSVTVRGTLDGRPDVKVVTHYALVGCERFLRVRSELFNGSADKQAFFIADGMHWGKRRVVPFAPARGQGYLQPELDLLELSALWSPFDFVAAATPATDSPGYAALSCSSDQLHGVNDIEISALGTPIEYVEPGGSLVLERILITAGGGDGPSFAIDEALQLRAQEFGERTQSVTGRIVAGGLPFGGDVRRASIVVREGDRPLTATVPYEDGTFSAIVASNGELTTEVWSFGRKVAEVTGTNLGDIDVPEPATVQLSVVRDLPNGPREAAWAIAVFVPDDEPTRADVTGTFHGRLDACAPWLGPPNGASPACNHVIVDPQGTDVEVPAGKYLVIATAGPEHTVDIEHVQLQPGEIVTVAIDIQKLDLASATGMDWMSADFHVHGRASFDSGIPDEDRVKTFVAAGVDVIAATDHDVIGDYTDVVELLGLADRVTVMGGLEATQLIPWLDVEGEDLPRVIGHFNFWPLERDLAAPRAGAPWDELIEPGTLFDRMAPLVGPGGMMMLNHPWGDPLFGRDTGYLRAIKFDPRVPVAKQPMLTRKPSGAHSNMDWTAIEIINGADMSEMMQARTLWHSLLAQGFLVTGLGNSDSHGMTDDHLGWARNWVPAGPDSPGDINFMVRNGFSSAGNGVIVTRRAVNAASVISSFVVPVPLDHVLEIQVLAAAWIPVDEVRIVTSRGTRVIASGAQLQQPTNPFGTELLRYSASIPISELVDRDDFIIVEAGLAYPLAADLDNDGVVDTSDNNGDGVVDQADVDPDEDVGPLRAPPDPTDPSDRRFLITRIARGAWPEGFANPIIVDFGGDGMWTPPGLAP